MKVKTLIRLLEAMPPNQSVCVRTVRSLGHYKDQPPQEIHDEITGVSTAEQERSTYVCIDTEAMK